MGKVEILAKKQKAYFLGINCGRLKSAKKPTQKLAAQFHLKQCSLQIRPPKKASQTFKNFRVRNKYYKKIRREARACGRPPISAPLPRPRFLLPQTLCVFWFSQTPLPPTIRAAKARIFNTCNTLFKTPKKIQKMPQPEKHSKPRHIQ